MQRTLGRYYVDYTVDISFIFIHISVYVSLFLFSYLPLSLSKKNVQPKDMYFSLFTKYTKLDIFLKKHVTFCNPLQKNKNKRMLLKMSYPKCLSNYKKITHWIFWFIELHAQEQYYNYQIHELITVHPPNFEGKKNAIWLLQGASLKSFCKVKVMNGQSSKIKINSAL